jgi:four helix bundle protein
MPTLKRYDLESRAANFAKTTRSFVKNIRLTPLSTNDIQQLIRSSGSIAANYIEANNSLGKADLAMRIRICKKEAKESQLWLQLLDVPPELDSERTLLAEEARQLVCIFGAILAKVKH